MTLTTELASATEKNILDVIASRRSLRSYAPTALSTVQIETLFEAARWAPSSMNEQPWHFLYATKDQPELWSKIFDTLADANKVWAKDAPLLIVSMSRNTFTRNDRPNPTAGYDLGSATAFLSLQATAIGLNVHQMGGYNREALRVSLNIPPIYDPVVVMAVGFPGIPDSLPENLKERELAPRSRRPRSEFVMNQPF